MRNILFVFLFFNLFFNSFAQTREAALEKFRELKKQAQSLEVTILAPDKRDIEAAALENVKVFRILPPDTYDVGILTVRGGGAYYSFVNQSHDYNAIPQISLERNKLSVGFYGANYGFLTQLGETPLAKIGVEDRRINFLSTYQPPSNEAKARIEQVRTRGIAIDDVSYQSIVPVESGQTYAARIISYDEADVLVIFKVYRQDTDGSVIIFWKLLKEFEKPSLALSPKVIPTQKTIEMRDKILALLAEKDFNEVTVDISTSPLTLRGTVPKGKLAEVISLIQNAIGKTVRNELTEK